MEQTKQWLGGSGGGGGHCHCVPTPVPGASPYLPLQIKPFGFGGRKGKLV